MTNYNFLYEIPSNLDTEEYHHFSNIVNSSARCFKKFRKYNEIVLLAEMQSGKTEVMKRMIYICHKYSKNLSNIGININNKNIFIIICSSSRVLKKQLTTRLPEVADQIYHLNDLNTLDKKILTRLANNSLIIFDECHGDSEQMKTIDKFRMNIEDISKKKNNNLNYHICNISATPYEQIIAHYPIVIMNPGEKYYGLRDIFNRNITNKHGKILKIINPAKDLTSSKNCKNLFDEIELINKYYIVRLPGNNANSEIIKNNIFKQFDKVHKKFNIITYDMKFKKNINHILNTKPLIPTIIYVKNKLRMGENLNTKYVYLVYDHHTNIHTHTTIQSLLGRCCGYNKKSHNTLIFCDIDKAKEHYKWLKHNYDHKYIPHHSKYILKFTNTIKPINIFSKSISN